jgi:ribosomal protein L33
MLVIVVVFCTADRFNLTSDESHGSLYLLSCSSNNSSSNSNSSTASTQQQPGGVTAAADNVHWSTTATASTTTAATGTTTTAQQQQQQQRLSAHLFCKKCGVHVCHAPSFPASAVADVNVHCIHTNTIASLTVAFIRDEVVLPGRGLPVLQQLELDDQSIHSSSSSQQQQQQQSQADDADSSDNAATGGEQSKERSQEQSNWPLQQRASLAHLAALSDSSAYDTLKTTAATADATSAATTALNTANSSLHSNAGSANAHWGVAAAGNTFISSSSSVTGSSSGGFRRASETLSLTIPSQRVVNADASADVAADASSSISGTTDWRRQQQQQQWQLEHDEAAGGVINDNTFASRFNQGEQQ